MTTTQQLECRLEIQSAFKFPVGDDFKKENRTHVAKRGTVATKNSIVVIVGRGKWNG